MYHVPMCVMCGENEVGTFQPHNEFCGDMCAARAHEALEVDKFYAGWTEDEADASMCQECGRKEAVEDGFCSFDCENRWFAAVNADEVQQEDAVSHTWEYEDYMAQYDDDPSPYGGTYSEE